MPLDHPKPSSTMLSPENGDVLKRDVRPFRVEYGGESTIVGLPGYYPDGDGESVHVGRDLAVADAALHALKVKVGKSAGSMPEAATNETGGQDRKGSSQAA